MPAEPSAPGTEKTALPEQPKPRTVERTARSVNGWPMLGLIVLLVAVAIAPLVIGIAQHDSGYGIALVVFAGLLLLAAVFLAAGLTPVAPREARVLQLLGRYTGTVHTDGLRWVNPITTRQRVSTRIRNHETETSKVNDFDGNPIEIAAVVVWQVADTAQAVFDVDDFVRFVDIQAETAVRHIANSYPYDAQGEQRRSLRDNADEISEKLSHEVADRVAPAGVRIVETRITHLAYAPEIASAMLRRQQAGAIIAARQRIVDGAVTMVESALERLAAREIVDLDEERKAAMVSNLLVVLVSDRDAQPVVNAGTLYQ